jgi:chaperonin GroES
MKLVPLEDRVVVKLVEQEDKTESGIVLPDTAKEKPQKATVMAAGPGKYAKGKLVPMPVKEGDLVVFAKYSGTEVKVEGEEYLVLRASDLLAILHESKK